MKRGKAGGSDLFDAQRQALTEREAPLAARMRPRTLDEFIGQEHIVGPGRLLRRAIQADQLSSVIFYGPPGTGKTTLARIIANTTRGHFIAINAVLAGVNDIRQAIAEAQERRGMYGQRTILFVDEVHRFNKAQQDALLPWVENGTVILVGATTENPYFEVNKALVSRSRIFQLRPLTEQHLYAVARQALADPERGYGQLDVRIDDDALAHLVDVSNGDARSLLNALELAVETTAPDGAPGGDPDRTPDGAPERATPPGSGGAGAQGADGAAPSGVATSGAAPGGDTASRPGVHITKEVAEESIQRRAVLYDKEGDVHYDTISAFIKSLRGSDPDAALYWMARMVYAGEDPRFIFRRMVIFAGEDVGLADPNAVRVVMACAQAFDYVGLPEGRFHLAEAALYLATAPKSNSAFAFFDALATVEKERESDIPAHLRDANRDAEGFGHGEGYLYPHAYRDHWVAQQYLPDALQGRVFYQPGDQGHEKPIKQEVDRRREAQLAAMLEGDAEGFGAAEVLTYSGPQVARERERWLRRAVSGASQRLAEQRDRILEAARLARHATVLDLNAGTGLLTWEALRRAPEGGTWALAATAAEAQALREQAAHLPELERPTVLQGSLSELPELLEVRGESALRFDALIGRAALNPRRRPAGDENPGPTTLPAAAALLCGLARPGAAVSLAEPVARRAQRLYALVELRDLGQKTARRLRAAEEAIYADPDDPLVNWDEDALRQAFEAAGFGEVQVSSQESAAELQITISMIGRWFGAAGPGERPSYRQRLAGLLSPEELAAVQALYERQLTGRIVPWRSVTAYLSARRP